MYCANCAAPISPGLSFCNRCGASLREKETSSSTGAISAFLTAITLLGVVGLGIMLGGALVLKNEAGFNQDFIAVFMFLTFLITGTTEIMLIRQLSRITSGRESKDRVFQPTVTPYELREAPGEPVNSVTENTTRTLEYSRRERN